MTYQEFVKLVDQTSNNFDWRYGQALMNVLHGVWPEKHTEIANSELDPYYREDIIVEILKDLEANWHPTNETD